MGYPPSFIKGRTKMKKIKTEEYSKWDKNLYKELTPLQALKEIKYMLDSPFTSSIIIQGLNTIENALVENEELKRQLALLKRVAFGQKSEKTVIEVNPDQLSLFNEAEKEQSVSEREEEKSIAIQGHSRNKKRTREDYY